MNCGTVVVTVLVLLGYISTENSHHSIVLCVHVEQETGCIPVAVTSNIDDRSGICAGKYLQVICGVLMCLFKKHGFLYWLSSFLILPAAHEHQSIVRSYESQLARSGGHQKWFKGRR